jgi:hypothetical protein
LKWRVADHITRRTTSGAIGAGFAVVLLGNDGDQPPHRRGGTILTHRPHDAFHGGQAECQLRDLAPVLGVATAPRLDRVKGFNLLHRVRQSGTRRANHGRVHDPSDHSLTKTRESASSADMDRTEDGAPNGRGCHSQQDKGAQQREAEQQAILFEIGQRDQRDQ